MNILLHNEKIIPVFCYNVPVSAVLYKLRSVFMAKNPSALKLLVSHLTLTLYKLDTSLIHTVRDGPDGVHLKESWLYWSWITVTGCKESQFYSLHLLAQNSFQLTPETFWWAGLITQSLCHLNYSKNFTCLLGKLRTDITGLEIINGCPVVLNNQNYQIMG